MNTEDSLLLNRCKMVGREVSRIADEYQSKIGDCPTIAAQLTKTVNRSREFENGSFIVLVVGPVKSGKSTLVNLIANAYVSPTHFLECTVRPSIISRRHEGEECKITVFTSHDTASRTEQTDAIIDCIRGMENEDELEGISKAEYELTAENIREKVELGLNDSFQSETLVTSITTPGGKLMRQNVFIIDMPGFDGEHANIDNPVYDTIAQRADLIIFVQSSNSAISKVSWQFLKMLSANNQTVPVCLIHNVFDSSWWRSDEEREAAVKVQKETAIKEIRKQGFVIDDDQCFCINLGKVEDGRKQQYQETQSLKNEVEEYDKIEDLLYERVISRRDAMRLSTCLSRTHQQVEKSIDAIESELNNRILLVEQYNKVVGEFDKVADTPHFLAGTRPLSVDYDALKQVVRSEARGRIMLIDTANNHKTDSEARRIVQHFVEDCEGSVSAAFERSLALSQKEEELFLECRKWIGEIKETAIRCQAQPLPIEIERIPLDGVPPVSLSEGIEWDLLISRKPRISLIFTRFGGHSAEDVVGYINKVAERLAGSMPEDSNNLKGYIEKDGGAIPPLLDQVRHLLEDVSQKYEDICKAYWQECRDAILNGIIPNKADVDAQTEQLKCLREDLAKISFSSN